jgi:hypothetical protein
MQELSPLEFLRGRAMAAASKPETDGLSWASWLVLGLVVFLVLVAGRAIIDSILSYPARYAAVALFGLLVGTTELVSRYRDNPVAPLTTLPGLVYVGTNTIASVLALWVLLRNGVNYDFGGMLPADLAQVLLAGFGTMARCSPCE